MGQRYIDDKSTLLDGKGFTATWRRGNHGFSALYLASLVQSDLRALYVLSKYSIVATLYSNNTAFTITEACYNPFQDAPNSCVNVVMNYLQRSKTSDRTEFINMLEAATRFANTQTCQALNTARFFDIFISHRDTNRNDLLIRAAEHGNLELARILLDKELPEEYRKCKNPKDNLGRNIIAIALDHGHEDFAKSLLTEQLVDMFLFQDTCDKGGETAFRRACDRELLEIVSLLWPRYSKANRNGKQLCAWAKKKEHLKIAKMFESADIGD
jgi:ankyrin repeat protein